MVEEPGANRARMESGKKREAYHARLLRVVRNF